MPNFTQTCLIGAVTTLIISLGACSSEQLTPDKSAPNIQIGTQHLPSMPAMAELAHYSMQLDAEEGSRKKGRILKINQLQGNIIDFVPAPSPNSETYAAYKENNTIRTSK
jgi:hypothetical protein